MILTIMLGAAKQANCQVQKALVGQRCFSAGSALGLVRYRNDKLDSVGSVRFEEGLRISIITEIRYQYIISRFH